jgi:hypothetical protein
MQNRRAGLAIAGLAIVAAVVLFIVLSGGDDSDDGDDATVAQTTTTETTGGQGNDGAEAEQPEKPEKPEKPEIPTVVVRDGQPEGGVQGLEFGEGDDIRFVVESNAEDEVHIHGYDLTEEVAPGSPARFSFRATIPGVFEVELHHAVTQIAELRVD